MACMLRECSEQPGCSMIKAAISKWLEDIWMHRSHQKWKTAHWKSQPLRKAQFPLHFSLEDCEIAGYYLRCCGDERLASVAVSHKLLHNKSPILQTLPTIQTLRRQILNIYAHFQNIALQQPPASLLFCNTLRISSISQWPQLLNTKE